MNDLEKDILRAFYEFNKRLRKRPPIPGEFNLENKGTKREKHEYAYYLLKLKKEGYLNFDETKTIIPGGKRDEVYLNSVAYFIPDKIEITDKVESLFEKKTTKIKRKVNVFAKSELKLFCDKVKNIVYDYFAKFVASLIILIILVIISKIFF